jgi:hypothetical protein
MLVYPSEAAQATVIVVDDAEFDGGLTAGGTFRTRDNGMWRCVVTMEPVKEAPMTEVPDLITYNDEAERGLRLLADATTPDEYALAQRGLLAETSSVSDLATTDDHPVSQAVDDILAGLKGA